jgi:hypothetical protein
VSQNSDHCACTFHTFEFRQGKCATCKWRGGGFYPSGEREEEEEEEEEEKEEGKKGNFAPVHAIKNIGDKK